MSSLRTKIIISTLFIIFLIVTGSYFVIQDIQSGIIEGEFREKGLLLANNLVAEVTTPLLVNDLIEIRNSIENIKINYPDIEYVYVTDSEGIVLVHTFDKGFPKALQERTAPSNFMDEHVFNTEKGIIHEFDAPLFKNIGYVHVGVSENRVRAQILEASRKLLMLAVSAIVLGGIFAYFIGRRLTEPIEKLTEGANRINKGILDQSIDINTRDELGELAKTFNEMALSLNQKINDLIAAKEQTEAAEKYLETVFNNILDGIIVVNSNHEIIKINKSFLEIMGMGEEQVLGRTCHEILFGTDKGIEEKCSIDALIQTKKNIKFVHEIEVGGTKKILDLSCSAFTDIKRTTNIVLVIRDITQQKALEEENIAFYNNIKYLKEFNEEILNNVNLAIHVVDKDMKLLAVNDELIRFSRGRIKKELVINKSLYEVYPFLKEKHVDMEYEHVIKTGEIFLSEEKTEYYDEVIYTSTSKIPIKDDKGNVEKIITVIKDVSDQKKLEEELKDSYEELRLTYLKLKELYKIKDNFLSNISHELRTPLTSVLGYTELLLEENISQEQRHKLEVILRNSKRLTRLIKSLLDSTLIESRNLQLDMQMLQINDVVAQVVEDMKTMASIKNLPIHTEIPPLPHVKGDRKRLIQVFSNILENAIKFTITGEIRITAIEENENIHIKISDTGIGIPEDKLLQIFDRFYQLDSSDSRKYSGTGLGLWISKNIIDAHDGRIWAESKNRGSTFHILLPKPVKE